MKTLRACGYNACCPSLSSFTDRQRGTKRYKSVDNPFLPLDCANSQKEEVEDKVQRDRTKVKERGERSPWLRRGSDGDPFRQTTTTNDDEGVGDTARMLTWAFRNAALKLK